MNIKKNNDLATGLDFKLNQESLENIKLLTKRERQILTYIGNRLSTKEIAISLSLSPSTVETHRKNIRRKLKLKTKDKLFEFVLLVNLKLDNNT